MVFYPVDAANDGKNPQIELVVEKKQMTTELNIIRTPFEEESYVAASWMRPIHLPMKFGPRCLRVSPPLPDMIVTNLTENYTNGKTLEGTVNRILLRLEAGQIETCKDVAIRVSCSSFLVSAAGVSTKISATTNDDEEKASVIDPTNPHARTPVLVKENKGAPARMTNFGYEVPKGWMLACGDGQTAGEDDYVPLLSTFESDDQSYAVFDIFRPSPAVARVGGASVHGNDDDGRIHEHSMCQSDIYVSIRYRQGRPAKKGKWLVAAKRRGERSSEDESVSPAGDDETDLVELTQTMSVQWSAPLSTEFSPGIKSSHPSGNRHPTNVVQDPVSRRSPIAAATESEMVLVDRERVTVKCMLEAAASADGLMVDVEEIRFEVSNCPRATIRQLHGTHTALSYSRRTQKMKIRLVHSHC